MGGMKNLSESVDGFGLPEDMEEWDTGIWVHYSKIPEVKINPQQSHQDPTGIYLFPESFKAEGGWYGFPYKFRCQVNLSNTLDLSSLSEKDSVRIYETLVPKEKRGFVPMDFRRVKHADVMWEGLRVYFIHVAQGPGAWNKALRNLGYDSVFDDTGSIFSNEVQLLVLDPRKVKVIERIDQKTTGFDRVTEVTEKLAKLLEPYGEVTVTKPKKQKFGGNRSGKEIQSHVEVKSGDKHLSWQVSTQFLASKDVVPTWVYVYLSWGAEKLRQGGSVGASFEWNKYPWDYSSLEKTVKKAADAEFQGETEAKIDEFGIPMPSPARTVWK
jgi:hypothetical protein